MIYVLNYASNRFLESQRIQNARWSTQPGDPALTVCSYTHAHVLPILRGLHLANEEDIRSVLAQSRGDGLWAWKAILTYHIYRNVAKEGDIIFYMDSGACPILPFDSIWEHIRTHGHLFVRVSAIETVPRVKEYIESLPEMKARISLLDDMDFSSRLWTKPFPATPDNEYGLPFCVLDRLAAAGVPLSAASARLLEMEQVSGGFQGYLKRQNNDRILSDLLENTSLPFFDDVVRGDARRPYIDHRQDQSMLSLIVNSESVRSPAFSSCIVNELVQVRVHRGYAPDYHDVV